MGRYSYWYRPILPMSDELDNTFHGHTRKKDKVWMHKVSEITCNNVSYNSVVIQATYFDKIIQESVNLVILSLVILLLILFT